MKTFQLWIYLFILGSFNSLFSQEGVGNEMIFQQFEKGTVIFKDGRRSSASLNYDMIQQQMLFMGNDSTIMKITNFLDISVVIIGERRFLPVSTQGVFYEEIPIGNNSFFVQRKAFIVSAGKATPYGGYSQTQSSTSFGSWSDKVRSSENPTPNEKLKLDIRCIYYLKISDSYKKFLSAKTLRKLFKGHESEIEKYANEQSIDFSKTDDVARIVEYGYSLISNK